MEELNRSVHTWIEESEHSGAGSDDGLSSPSAAGAPSSMTSHACSPHLCPVSSLHFSAVTGVRALHLLRCCFSCSARACCNIAGMSAASSSFATGPDRTPPPMISRSQLATIVSGVPTAADVFPSPPQQSRNGSGAPQRSPIAVRRLVDPATAKPQVGESCCINLACWLANQ
jgi:hypothetical protein